MKLKSNVRLLITCDSGAGAGKTTASKYLSKQFGLNLLTSGLLYRYVAYKLLDSKKAATDIIFLTKKGGFSHSLASIRKNCFSQTISKLLLQSIL